MTHDIFISYGRGDRELVAAIARRIEERGLSVWYDARIEAAPEWSEQVAEAINGAAVVAVLFSAECNRSRRVKREVTHAEELGKPIVPILVEDVEPRGDILHALAYRNWASAHPDPRAHAADIAALLAQRAANPSSGELPAAPDGKPAARMSRFKRRALTTATLGAYGAVARRRAIRSFRSSLGKL